MNLKDSQITQQELKNIFNLFQPNKNAEIEVKQINNLLKQLDTLQFEQKNSTKSQKQPQNLKKKLSQSSDTQTQQQQQQNQQQQQQQQYQQQYQQQQKPHKNKYSNKGYLQSLKKNQDSLKTKSQNSYENSSHNNSNSNNQKQSAQNNTSQQEQQQQQQQQQLQEEEGENVKITEINCFPGNKQTLNFQEFSQYFSEITSNSELHANLIQDCFQSMDFNQEGYLDTSKIQNLFEVFQDQTSYEDIANVIKFCGIKNDKISIDEFQELFQKNF